MKGFLNFRECKDKKLCRFAVFHEWLKNTKVCCKTYSTRTREKRQIYVKFKNKVHPTSVLNGADNCVGRGGATAPPPRAPLPSAPQQR